MSTMSTGRKSCGKILLISLKLTGDLLPHAHAHSLSRSQPALTISGLRYIEGWFNTNSGYRASCSSSVGQGLMRSQAIWLSRFLRDHQPCTASSAQLSQLAGHVCCRDCMHFDLPMRSASLGCMQGQCRKFLWTCVRRTPLMSTGRCESRLVMVHHHSITFA